MEVQWHSNGQVGHRRVERSGAGQGSLCSLDAGGFVERKPEGHRRMQPVVDSRPQTGSQASLAALITIAVTTVICPVYHTVMVESLIFQSRVLATAITTDILPIADIA